MGKVCCLHDSAKTGSLNFNDVREDQLKLIIMNQRITTREIGFRLNEHLQRLGLSSKLDVWVPHVLTRAICVVVLKSAIRFSNVIKMIPLGIALLRVTENKLYTSTANARG